MSPRFIVLLAGCLASAPAAVVAVFSVGKFNQFVALRHRIATEMLQLDFALRLQSAELLALADRIPGGIGQRIPDRALLAGAEAQCHRAVSMRLGAEALGMLSDAAARINRCWEKFVASGPEDIAETARQHVSSNARAWEKIVALAADYNRAAGPFYLRPLTLEKK
jgi:hypothetical protein